jgi:hypothetical protein
LEKCNLPNSLPGFPKFNPSKTTYEKMGIQNPSNGCKEIISKGSRLVLDHE